MVGIAQRVALKVFELVSPEALFSGQFLLFWGVVFAAAPLRFCYTETAS